MNWCCLRLAVYLWLIPDFEDIQQIVDKCRPGRLDAHRPHTQQAHPQPVKRTNTCTCSCTCSLRQHETESTQQMSYVIFHNQSIFVQQLLICFKKRVWAHLLAARTAAGSGPGMTQMTDGRCASMACMLRTSHVCVALLFNSVSSSPSATLT